MPCLVTAERTQVETAALLRRFGPIMLCHHPPLSPQYYFHTCHWCRLHGEESNAQGRVCKASWHSLIDQTNGSTRESYVSDKLLSTHTTKRVVDKLLEQQVYACQKWCQVFSCPRPLRACDCTMLLSPSCLRRVLQPRELAEDSYRRLGQHYARSSITANANFCQRFGMWLDRDDIYDINTAPY